METIYLNQESAAALKSETDNQPTYEILKGKLPKEVSVFGSEPVSLCRGECDLICGCSSANVSG